MNMVKLYDGGVYLVNGTEIVPEAAAPEAETPAFVVAGGVAANARLRSTFTMVASSQGFTVMVPR